MSLADKNFGEVAVLPQKMTLGFSVNKNGIDDGFNYYNYVLAERHEKLC